MAIKRFDIKCQSCPIRSGLIFDGNAYICGDCVLKKLDSLRSALERLRRNAQRIFDKVPVRDWAETLAEADAVLEEKAAKLAPIEEGTKATGTK